MRSEKKTSFRQVRRKLSAWLIDTSLVIGGVALAGASAYLPWHIHTNPHLVRPPEMNFVRIDADQAGASDLAEVDNETLDRLLQERPQALEPAPQSDFLVVRRLTDPTITSALPSGARQVGGQAIARNRPDPENAADGSPVERDSDYAIVFSDGQSVLISDGEDLYPLSIGSRLPDGSSIVRLQRTDDGWTATTSRNRTIIEMR